MKVTDPSGVQEAEQEHETLRPGMIPGLFAGLPQLLMRSGTPQEPQKRLPGVHAAPQAGQFASSFVISAIDVRLTGAAAVGAGSGRARRPNGHMRQFWRRRRGWSRGLVSSAPGVRPASSRRRTAQSRSAARVVTRVCIRQGARAAVEPAGLRSLPVPRPRASGCVTVPDGAVGAVEGGGKPGPGRQPARRAVVIGESPAG